MARGSRGLCPLGLWPHQVSLLSWGSAGWTPPSRMPSYPWDYIQLARPPLRTGACPPPRAPDWEPPGDLQASPLPGCPPYSCIWRLLLWLPLRSPARLTAPPTPGSACQIRPVCPSLCPLLWVQDPLRFSHPTVCLTRWFSSLSPHLWLPACCPAHLPPVCLFPVSPSARRPSPSG